MNNYIFDIRFPDGEILRDLTTADTRKSAEKEMKEKYPEAESITFTDVR